MDNLSFFILRFKGAIIELGIECIVLCFSISLVRLPVQLLYLILSLSFFLSLYSIDRLDVRSMIYRFVIFVFPSRYMLGKNDREQF